MNDNERDGILNEMQDMRRDHSTVTDLARFRG
jgi:hypothetical protein